MYRPAVLSLCVLAFIATAAAQTPAITLSVDATTAPQKIVHSHMTIPVNGGLVTLYYPKWIPGEHEPDGPIINLTGLHFATGGKPVSWTRDTLDVYTFHVDVPGGSTQLDIDFDYIEDTTGQYTAGGSATAKLVDLNWNQNLLLPGNTPAGELMIQATLTLPPDWKFGSPLAVQSQSGNSITFKTTTATELIDSPVIAGQYYRSVDITPPGESVHHELDIVADSPQALLVTPDLQQDMMNLVEESGRMFGTRHYRDYHFLLTLSDHVSHFGLEHHECDDSRLPERALLSGGATNTVGELLPHEYVHSWNGKFRRPQDLSSAPYEAPMQTDLLWVYEGLTDYLGNVLAARSGLWSNNEYRQFIADIGAMLGPGRPGRTWQPLLDTAVVVPGMFNASGWENWRRPVDYYEEGDLLWLEVSTIIHDQSHGGKSLEDFLRAFYGGPNQGPELKTYTFDDLVEALNQVAPYDWATYFHNRLTSTSPDAPLGGVTAGGWRLEMTPNGRNQRGGDLRYSIGLSLGPDGAVQDSVVGGPAYRAGITSGMKVIGVNGRLFTSELIDDAVVNSTASTDPIQLLIVNDDYYVTCLVDYHGGPRAPRLARDNSKPDYLDTILNPLAPAH